MTTLSSSSRKVAWLKLVGLSVVTWLFLGEFLPFDMLLDVELPGDHFGQHTGEAANRAAPGEHPVPVDDRRHRNAVVGTHVTVDRGEHVVGRDGEGKFVETVEFCDGIRGIAADGDELHLFFTQFMGEQPNLRKGGGSVLTEGPEEEDGALLSFEVGEAGRSVMPSPPIP